MHMKKYLMGLLLVASVSLGSTFDQVIFSESFDGYPADKPLPQKGAWIMVQQNEAKNRFAHIRADKGNKLSSGENNQVLQIRDQDTSGAVRLVATVLPDTGSELVRVSFDAYEPTGELDGSLAVKMGKGMADAKKKEAVNGLKLQSGAFRPKSAGGYPLDQKIHVDLWFNESTNTIKYAVDGVEWPLHPGRMAVWVNGSGVAVNETNDREVLVLTAMSALRIETFSSPTQEIWFDNIEVAVPTGFKVEEKQSAKVEEDADPNYLVPAGITSTQVNAEHARIKQRYIQFLIGTESTFKGKYGAEAAAGFINRIEGAIKKAMAFDFKKDAGKTFHAFEKTPELKKEAAVYSPILQQYLLALAYGYTVNAPDNPYYKNPKVLETYMKCLAYLHGRGIREGMTFHNNQHRMEMDGAPVPTSGACNLVKMELRMGAYCQSVLLMESYFKETKMFLEARKLVRQLEMLGKTSGHVRYYDPFINPPEFKYRAQSDAIQNYGDTTLVSALLETDTKRRYEMLLDARRVFTDSCKVIPGWSDTIKPDFTGFHHRGIYGNAYTGGFIPQAAFGIWLLDGTKFNVEAESVENVKKVIETYRLYCQKYAMPFGIRGRMPVNTHNIKTQVFPGILMYASTLGLDDAEVKAIYKRLWDKEQVGLEFLFNGGRGKIFRGMYCLDMLEQLETENIQPEPNPNGYWYKPYGGLAIHRRDNWMAAIKGYSKYIWDYENGHKLENIYGQYFSHGSLTIFAKGNPVNDIESGYNLNEGWDWYRMPGTTAVHFPIKPRGTLEHREFSPETFLGGVSADGNNGLFAMKLNQSTFGDGTAINLKGNKSVFFVDDFILMLGSDISGGDGKHAVETTLFQTQIPSGTIYTADKSALFDAAGNRYYVPDGSQLKTFKGLQRSFEDDGKTATSGNYAVAWFDHGLNPGGDGYEAGIGVRGAAKPDYLVVRKDSALHQVDFPEKELVAYAFFQPLELDQLIKKVDEPCLVMMKKSGDEVHLSLANPDLGFLPHDAEMPTFNYINEGENQYLPSQLRPVEISLAGKWKLKSPSEQVTVLASREGQTLLQFNCIHGVDVRVELVQE